MTFVKPFLACLALVTGWFWIANVKKASASEPIEIEPVTHASYDAASIQRDISFHQSRVARDPKGAIGWSMLAESWLARSRESDSDVAAWKAEATARKSLKLRERGNGRAFMALISSLLEQHRFQDAKHALEMAGNRTRIYADVLIEIGDLNKAEAILHTLDADPSVLATRARISSERGDHSPAIRLLRQARSVLEANPSVSEPTLAWYDAKIGAEYLRQGRLAEADSSYAKALRLYPRSYKATLGLARVAATRGDWKQAIDFAERTLEVANSLEAVALLGDANRALGDSALAAKHFARCRQMYREECATFTSAGKGGRYRVRPIDRQFASFCAEHQMFVDEGLEAATRDLKNRPDLLAKKNLSTLKRIANSDRPRKRLNTPATQGSLAHSAGMPTPGGQGSHRLQTSKHTPHSR
jgi:tetratricopeptide (TPR) repeat protein